MQHIQQPLMRGVDLYALEGPTSLAISQTRLKPSAANVYNAHDLLISSVLPGFYLTFRTKLWSIWC